MYHKQAFTLVSAIFILVILALAGSFVVSLAGISSATSTFSIQGTRAFFAARSGLEWGIFQVVNDATQCPPTTTLNLTQAGANGFSVQVTCSLNNFTEGPLNYNIFEISAFAERGSFGDIDYVSRRIQATITRGL